MEDSCVLQTVMAVFGRRFPIRGLAGPLDAVGAARCGLRLPSHVVLCCGTYLCVRGDGWAVLEPLALIPMPGRSDRKGAPM